LTKVLSRTLGDIAAAGRPTIYIGDANGEVARLLRQHGCGIAIAPGDAEALVNTVQQWSSQPAIMAEMGANARAMLEARYSREQGLTRWRLLLDKITQSSE